MARRRTTKKPEAPTEAPAPRLPEGIKAWRYDMVAADAQGNYYVLAKPRAHATLHDECLRLNSAAIGRTPFIHVETINGLDDYINVDHVWALSETLVIPPAAPNEETSNG